MALRDLVKKIIAYCRKFPTQLVRPCYDSPAKPRVGPYCKHLPARKYKYDPTIEEFFVETSDMETLRHAELEQVSRSEDLKAGS